MKEYLTKEQTDKLFMTITSNGCREMEEDRFHQAINEAIHTVTQQTEKIEVVKKCVEYEPSYGWCDVKGCDCEGSSGGAHWRDTGYWTLCSSHGRMAREGKPQPKMKREAIKREKNRDKISGCLP